MIYLSRGYRNSDYLAIRPGGRGDVTATHVAMAGAVRRVVRAVDRHYDGLLYMTNEVGVVTCADARTGERVWRHRLGGVFFASPVAGDGKIYMVSETGETYVLRAGRDAGGAGAQRPRRALPGVSGDFAGADAPAERPDVVCGGR